MSLDTDYQNAFGLWIGDSPFNEEELDSLRLRAWREQGILITAVSDERLSPKEKVNLCQIGSRLYGEEDCA